MGGQSGSRPVLDVWSVWSTGSEWLTAASQSVASVLSAPADVVVSIKRIQRPAHLLSSRISQHQQQQQHGDSCDEARETVSPSSHGIPIRPNWSLHIHCKNIRISKDILWWVFQIFMESVPCTFASVNRRNNKVRDWKLATKYPWIFGYFYSACPPWHKNNEILRASSSSSSSSFVPSKFILIVVYATTQKHQS